MGVPKFYRWLSERYPCLSQVIREHQIPEFDNLYLDMNGIIHPCSHPNNDDPHFRISEGEIFKNIFNYIEVLFRIIKPKKNFFMAVDGCAPRAKMNQQRSRRFRTAKEAEDNIRKAIMKGQTLPTEERFDSNCITPGTEFMSRLQLQLKYFINHKISTDPMWQHCDVYLSGHNVPGEGEHKIMDFIRYHRSQPGYNPNTRHCLYGLDADLIMLGLSSHEPYFSLLREEIRFGKQEKRMVRPEHQTFHLLHLSLMREYIDMEFSVIASKLHFRYDLERIIDDWILLGFLVGNDFVPHLPNLHINHDALPFLYQCYKDFMVTSDGYINDGGLINLNRLKKYFGCLSKFDRNHFEDVYADTKWLESKGTGKLLEESNEATPGRGKGKKFSEIIKGLDDSDFPTPGKKKNPFEAVANISGAFDEFSFNETPVKSASSLTRNKPENSHDNDVEIEDEEAFELEFKQHKRHYYMEKFDMDIVDDDQVQTICYEYVRALQWICHYYFNGLQSWDWYYPYHYSPYISDVANFEVKELHFDMNQPFHPFEQLLAVLPAASKKLLPEAFQNLMCMDNSPIIDFYPPDFRTDLNGKQQDWEAVVLIPFIDERRLLEAMLKCYSCLTDEEKERNSFGCCYKYRFDKSKKFLYESSYPGLFEDISVCRAKDEEIDREFYHLDLNQLKKGILKGTKLDVYFHGFPTMKHIKHTCYLKRAGVKVFQQNSRYDNAIVKILSENKPVLSEIAAKFIGEIVYVEWPYMVEGMVVSMTDEASKYFLDEQDQLTSSLVEGDHYKRIRQEMKNIETTHFNRRGIELGKVNILMEVKLLLGKRYNCSTKGVVKLNKEWSPHSNYYAFQSTVKDVEVVGSKEDECNTLDDLYKPGSNCFMLGYPHYGCSGEVIECILNEGRVRVALKVAPEPNFNKIMKQYDRLAVHYISDFAVAQRVGISTHLLSRITGDVIVYLNPKRKDVYNIGLKLKYSGQNKEVIGYARRSASGWTYSPAAIKMLKDYMNKFPEVFEKLGRITDNETLFFHEIWPRKNESFLDEIKSFLKVQPSYNSNPVQCGSSSLDEPVVQAIEDSIEKFKELNPDRKIVKVKVKARALFRTSEHFGSLSADPCTDFLLFDRVVNIQPGSVVPLGLRGTVIGIHDAISDNTEKGSSSVAEKKYEVMFDEEFLGGMKTRALKKRCYFVPGNSLINLSFGERKEKAKKGEKVDSADFQNKISQPMKATDFGNNKSPFSQRTPGILHTPPHVYKDATKRQTPGSYNIKQSPSWLKGAYQSPSYNSPTWRNSAEKKRFSSPAQVQNSNDFMSMWQEMEKVKQQDASSSVDKNATKELQTMLRLNSQEKTPPKQDHTQSKQVTPAQANSTPKMISPRQPQVNIFNQLNQQSPGLKQNTNPLVEKPPSLSTLFQYCMQNGLPAPTVAYSKSMQGVSAVIMIGSLFKYSGNRCLNETLACESAAELALQHLMSQSQFQSPPNVAYASVPQLVRPPQGYMSYPPTNLFRPATAYPMPRVLYQSPSYNTSPPQQQQQRYLPNPYYEATKKSNSTTNVPQQRSSENLFSGNAPLNPLNQFVPHQVLVKKKPSETIVSATLPHQSTHGSSTINPDNELKSLLGINRDKKDEELKGLLGIDKSPANQSFNQKENISEGDDILKNMLGVSSGVKETEEDIKIKTMLGIGTSSLADPNSSSTMQPASNFSTPGQVASGDSLANFFSTLNITSNITTHDNSSPQQQTAIYSSTDDITVTQGIPPTQPKNQTHQQPQNTPVNEKPRKQILLAPSFFGPKNK